MHFLFQSFKGLAETLQVMTFNIKPTLALASGLTAIFTTGIVVTKIPDSIASVKQMGEKTKETEAVEQTKQTEAVEQTKQTDAVEKTKQMQLEIDLIKVRRRWF